MYIVNKKRAAAEDYFDYVMFAWVTVGQELFLDY